MQRIPGIVAVLAQRVVDERDEGLENRVMQIGESPRSVVEADSPVFADERPSR
jgi:hypothetical protein